MSKLFTATINYFATGEGVTRHFFATVAQDRESFLVAMKKVIEPYWVQGAEVYEGLPPPSDPVANFMLTKRMRQFLSGRPDAFVQVHLELHYNAS